MNPIAPLIRAWRAAWAPNPAIQEVARVRAQWTELQADILNTMEKLNQLVGRIAKREAKAVRGACAEPEEHVQIPATLERKLRKLNLRSRINAGEEAK